VYMYLIFQFHLTGFLRCFWGLRNWVGFGSVLESEELLVLRVWQRRIGERRKRLQKIAALSAKKKACSWFVSTSEFSKNQNSCM
jgi:hypothetical protein